MGQKGIKLSTKLTNLQELINEADKIFIKIRKRKDSKPLYEDVLDIAIAQNKKFEIEYIKGKLCLIDNNPHNAFKHLDNATKINENNLMAWNYKGVALDDLKDYEGAIKCYNKAIRIDSNFYLAWNNKGVAFDSLAANKKDLGMYKTAIGCYNEVIKANPTEIEDLLAATWSNKGEALNHLGKHERAFECFNESLSLNPNFIKAWNYKGLSLCNLKKYNDAIKCYDEGIKQDNSYIWLYVNKGRALNNMDYHLKAIECFDKALSLNDSDSNANNTAKKNRISSLIYLGKAKKDDIKELYSLEISEVEKCEDSPEKD